MTLDSRVVDLINLRRKVLRELSDAEWDDKPSTHLKEQLNHIDEKIQRGELWEPMF